MASKPFYSVADRILGSKFLEDIAEFFLLFQTMYDGFVERAEAVTRTLADKRTTFVVVSTLESAPVREAEFFIDALEDRGLHLGAVVLNKVLPGWFLDKGATGAAQALCARSDELAAALPTAIGAPEQVGRVLREVGESFLNFQVVAKREAEIRAELSAAPEVVAAVPVLRPRHHRPGRAARTSASRSGGDDRRRSRWRRATRPPRRPPSRCWRRAATPSTPAWPPASRRRSPSPRSRAWRAAGSSWPARATGEEVLFDFFVDTPGRGRPAGEPCRSTSTRWSCGSPAPSRPSTSASARWRCPAAWPGWLHAHRRLGRVALDVVTAPARRLAAEGVEVNDQQAYLLRILEPILTRTPEAAAIAAPDGRLLARGDRLVNPALAAFLGDLDERGFAEPRLAGVDRAGHGRRRRPAHRRRPRGLRGGRAGAAGRCSWRGHRLLTNPPPAFGGELVALGLLELEAPARAGRPAAGSVGARGGAGRGDDRDRRGARGRAGSARSSAGGRPAAPPT